MLNRGGKEPQRPKGDHGGLREAPDRLPAFVHPSRPDPALGTNPAALPQCLSREPQAMRPTVPSAITPRFVRSLLARTALTQDRAARALRVHPRTMRRWVSRNPKVWQRPPMVSLVAMKALGDARQLVGGEQGAGITP
jgi:hypothetical protein